MTAAPGTEGLSGLRKAAILVVQLGQERAAPLLARLRESEIEELTAEIMRLRALRAEQVDAVMGEFAELASAHRVVGQGGLDFAKEVLTSSLGAERAAEMLDRLSAAAMNQPFLFLHQADPRQIVTFLSGEHPQTIALVLAHLRPEQASTILAALPADVSAAIAHRVAVMEPAAPDVVRTVESVLQRKTSSVLKVQQASVVGGLQPLVEIINRADRSTEKLLLEGLAALDPALAEEVRAMMFVFEDITSLDDRAVQLVLRQVETSEVALALKGVREDVRDVVLRNMSERARENLVEEIEMLGPVRLSQVEEAQAAVVRAIRSLEETGQIVLRRSDDDALVG